MGGKSGFWRGKGTWAALVKCGHSRWYIASESQSLKSCRANGAFLDSDVQFLCAMSQDITPSNFFRGEASSFFTCLLYLAKLNYQETSLSETMADSFVICSHLYQQRVLNRFLKPLMSLYDYLFLFSVFHFNFGVVLKMQGLIHGRQIYYWVIPRSLH